MRPKIILGAVLASFLLVLGVGFLGKALWTVESPLGQTPAASSKPTIVNKTATRPARHEPARFTDTITDPAAEAQKSIQELDDIFVAGGEEAREKISGKLSHPDRRVRLAALTNLVQLDDRAAIPALQEAADRTTDPEEKDQFLKAIAFLELPAADVPTRLPASKTNLNHLQSEPRGFQLPPPRSP